jgi:hypothetical protein
MRLGIALGIGKGLDGTSTHVEICIARICGIVGRVEKFPNFK